MGLAFVRAMCSDTHALGLTQDGGRSLDGVGVTAAHELGHNFNMNHDTSEFVASLWPCVFAAFSA